MKNKASWRHITMCHTAMAMCRIVIGTAIIGLATACSTPQLAGLERLSSNGQPRASAPTTRTSLSQVKVAALYENITDGVQMGRSIDETIRILKETNTELVFRGFWKWAPVVNSPDDISPELLELAQDRNLTPRQISESLRNSGHYYKEMERWISAIKKEMPAMIFVGAVPAQTLGRVEYNPITGRVYDPEETWAMALDPQKWRISRDGKPVTKEQFQTWFYGIHPYGPEMEQYDRRLVPAYFPDITNAEFQELFLSWAKKQIDCGADAIWIDMLYHQAARLAQMTGDVKHPALVESVSAASKLVDEIHKYGESRGKNIYVGSWDGPFGVAAVAGLEFPYAPPSLDFVTVSPSNREVLDKKMGEAKWNAEIPAIREKFGDIPIFAFIDWAFDDSQTVMFSQKLTKAEQNQVLRTFDESFAEMGVNFIYPVHGGYLGGGELTTRLAFGKFRTYDSLAPEFETYETIKELAQDKKR